MWEAALPGQADDEQRIGIALLRELAKGEPVSVARLERVLDTLAGEVESVLRDSSLKPLVYWGDDGRVEGFWGLTTHATHHRFTVDGRTLGTFCAQDSLFLPELLGETARIESSDPLTGEPVRLTVSPERVEAVDPDGVALSITKLDAADFSSVARVIATACHFTYFFAERASAEGWVAEHPQTVLVSLKDAFAFGRRQNNRIFGR